jgi:hypothetical protein
MSVELIQLRLRVPSNEHSMINTLMKLIFIGNECYGLMNSFLFALRHFGVIFFCASQKKSCFARAPVWCLKCWQAKNWAKEFSVALFLCIFFDTKTIPRGITRKKFNAKRIENASKSFRNFDKESELIEFHFWWINYAGIRQLLIAYTQSQCPLIINLRSV